MLAGWYAVYDFACFRLCSLVRVLGVPGRDIIYRLRSWIAQCFEIQDEAARRGDWWEIDLIVVILLGSIALGVWAWIEM